MPVEVKDNWIFYRIKDPGRFHRMRWNTIANEGGSREIAQIVGRYKEKHRPEDVGRGKTDVQAYRFKLKTKDNPGGWTVAEARKWVKEHQTKGKSMLGKNIRYGFFTRKATEIEVPVTPKVAPVHKVKMKSYRHVPGTQDESLLDKNKVRAIAKQMSTTGKWVGQPLVVLAEADEALKGDYPYFRLYTGHHRFAAAQIAELKEIPVVRLRDVFTESGMDYDKCMDSFKNPRENSSKFHMVVVSDLTPEIMEKYGIERDLATTRGAYQYNRASTWPWALVGKSLVDLVKAPKPRVLGPNNIIGQIGRAAQDGKLGVSLAKLPYDRLEKARQVAVNLAHDLVCKPGDTRKAIEICQSDLNVVQTARKAIEDELAYRHIEGTITGGGKHFKSKHAAIEAAVEVVHRVPLHIVEAKDKWIVSRTAPEGPYVRVAPGRVVQEVA
jgi:hypothetical protein